MSQRHAVDVVSLVFGTVFAGFTIVWLFGVTGGLDGHDSWWAGPVVLVAAGAAGLVASLRPGRDRADDDAISTKSTHPGDPDPSW